MDAIILIAQTFYSNILIFYRGLWTPSLAKPMGEAMKFLIDYIGDGEYGCFEQQTMEMLVISKGLGSIKEFARLCESALPKSADIRISEPAEAALQLEFPCKRQGLLVEWIHKFVPPEERC
jgi:hypothetical protein